MKKHAVVAVASLTLVALSGCKSEGYMSSIPLTGASSRDQLADSVRETMDEQRECFDEFVEAYALLQALQAATPGSGERAYDELRSQVDECARSLTSFHGRVARAEEDAATLFTGWEAELAEFQSDAMRQHSAERLEVARREFGLVHEALTGVHGQMGALLDSHRDYVLYFNHNSADASDEVLDQENERFEVNMANLEQDCGLVEEDAREFLHQVAGAPDVESAPAE